MFRLITLQMVIAIVVMNIPALCNAYEPKVASKTATPKTICPERLETNQSAQDLESGYSVIKDRMGSQRLSYVGLFNGKPEHLAEVIPTQTKNDKYEWAFSNETQDHDLWIACHYTRTYLVVTKLLPRALKKCEVQLYSKTSGLIEGHQRVKSISCE